MSTYRQFQSIRFSIQGARFYQNVTVFDWNLMRENHQIILRKRTFELHKKIRSLCTFCYFWLDKFLMQGTSPIFFNSLIPFDRPKAEFDYHGQTYVCVLSGSFCQWTFGRRGR